jgi:hypothetical protein
VNQDITLEAAAAATGQPLERLRTWCATGKLRCEKDGDDWLIPLAEVVRVEVLVEARDAAIAAGRAEALVVPLASASPDLGGEVARRLGLARGAVTTSTLALDGTEYVLAVWKVAHPPAPHELEPLIELAEELGGQVLEGDAKRGCATERPDDDGP